MTAAPAVVRKVCEGEDFSGQNFAGANISHRVFRNCCFDNADMAETDATFCDFTGSTFRGTNLYYTNFHRSKLACCVWEPKDCFGVTLTHTCSTFQDMKIGKLWWCAWVVNLLSMQLVGTSEPLKDKLIAYLGAERYVKLRSMFGRRDL